MDKGSSRHAIRMLFWEIGAPVVAYYALNLLGASALVAITGAAAVSVGRTLYVAVRHRRFDGFAALIGVMFLIGLALTLATGDPRVAVAKDSVMTGVTGVAFLASCLAGRPMMFAMAKRMLPETRQAEVDQRWRDDPMYRSRLVVLSLIWGVILFAEALARIALVCTLPVSAMVGLSHGLQFAAIGLALACTIVYARRSRRQAARHQAARAQANFA
ncbi:MAG: hypothetical protein J2P26_01890 [Nocardiopsaceae bacterium]|nr:hypothetical protein [Nocardiopsaceae bacterium]